MSYLNFKKIQSFPSRIPWHILLEKPLNSQGDWIIFSKHTRRWESWSHFRILPTTLPPLTPSYSCSSHEQKVILSHDVRVSPYYSVNSSQKVSSFKANPVISLGLSETKIESLKSNFGRSWAWWLRSTIKQQRQDSHTGILVLQPVVLNTYCAAFMLWSSFDDCTHWVHLFSINMYNALF